MSEPTYVSPCEWNPARPHILVVACSDGRLQEPLDDFLAQHLGITDYDRLYLPGGPGALASSGSEYARSDRHRREFEFLLEAHELEEIIYVFHGPADDGPPEAACADYRRVFGMVSVERLRDEQLRDAAEILHHGYGFRRNVRARFYWSEVRGDGHVQFVERVPDVASVA
ncbi:MAG TPA: hypothetical protein VM328_02075 [Fimbriimonadaceae bacterium]|nr:hypothetical protein [Fimbriimonadaceae bacterium]